MNIVLIGASGFVGTRLIEILKETHALVNIDKRMSDFFPKITQIADVRDIEILKEKLVGQDLVVLLAAEHRDDVSPSSLYYDVNVHGMRNTLEAMESNGVKRIVFTSSVAVYGLNKKSPDEEHPVDPFNHYGKSKWQAEEVLLAWYKIHPSWNINILRPTVIFGERNRGNVYNLLKQIASGKFLMIGPGNNKKSMAYIGNIVAFIKCLVEQKTTGYNVYNYVDKPDFSMNELVDLVKKVSRKRIASVRIPYTLGMLAGYGFDLVAKLTGKKLSVSSVRVKKFCATTQYDASKVHKSGFVAPFTLEEGLCNTLGYEFNKKDREKDDITFESE